MTRTAKVHSATLGEMLKEFGGVFTGALSGLVDIINPVHSVQAAIAATEKYNESYLTCRAQLPTSIEVLPEEGDLWFESDVRVVYHSNSGNEFIFVVSTGICSITWSESSSIAPRLEALANRWAVED